MSRSTLYDEQQEQQKKKEVKSYYCINITNSAYTFLCLMYAKYILPYLSIK